MRILNLTDAVAAKFLKRRGSSHDAAAEHIAARILADVRKNGDAALFRWALRLDGLRLTRKVAVDYGRAEIRAARPRRAARVAGAIEHAARNIRRVADEQRPRSWTITVEPGVRVGQRVTPLGTIGCYIPGGRFLFFDAADDGDPSASGRRKAHRRGLPEAESRVARRREILGVTEIARMGGAQAIGAFAYGTQSIPRVDKICGPGNRYVTAAKRIVSNDCAIDMPAGPTEVLILATGGNRAALHRRGFSGAGRA
jgi:histidinol dehydrogenase